VYSLEYIEDFFGPRTTQMVCGSFAAVEQSMLDRLLGMAEAPKGFGSHEVTPFSIALHYGEAPPGVWTGSARPGELESQSEYITYNFNWLQVRRLWFNPVLDSSGQKPLSELTI
jgi:hypothetical protein